MIDTIKIAVYKDSNLNFYETLLHASNQKLTGFIERSSSGLTQRQNAFIMKINKFDSYEQLIINGELKTPSHNYSIHWRCYEDRVTFEFSIPKLIYGTNSIEIQSHLKKNFNVSPYKLLRIGISSFFDLVFPLVKINYGGVELLRFDFCYNQLFDSREQSLKALNYIKLKHQGRGDRLNFEYGYIELSKSKYFKIYHKGEEYKKHDFRKLLDRGLSFEKRALNYQRFSDKILRYERKYTPKSWSYFYNVNILHRGQESIKKKYYESKKLGSVSKSQRRDFETFRKFTIGYSTLNHATKLDPFFFDLLYRRFKSEIKKRYSIGKVSVHRLHKEVIENDKQKTMKLRILAYIKVFKSLKRAHESGAFSDSTYYRYEAFMRKHDLSSTKLKSNIPQCWDHKQYYSHLRKHLIVPHSLTVDLPKYRFDL